MIADYLDRITQPAERNSIVKRLVSTLASQKHIAAQWMWEHKDIPSWEADLHDISSGNDSTSFALFLTAEKALLDADNHRRRALAGLHTATVRGVTIARVRWREVPERRPLVARLRAGAATPEGILEEALAWEVAWQSIEPDLVPIPGLTPAAFQAQHAAARALERPRAEAAVAFRLAAGRFGVKLDAINDALQRWYAAATAYFYDPESDERACINLIPTTFVPRYAKTAKKRRASKRAAKTAAGAEEVPGAGGEESEKTALPLTPDP